LLGLGIGGGRVRLGRFGRFDKNVEGDLQTRLFDGRNGRAIGDDYEHFESFTRIHVIDCVEFG